jgi:hypothetical protein
VRRRLHHLIADRKDAVVALTGSVASRINVAADLGSRKWLEPLRPGPRLFSIAIRERRFVNLSAGMR